MVMGNLARNPRDSNKKKSMNQPIPKRMLPYGFFEMYRLYVRTAGQ